MLYELITDCGKYKVSVWKESNPPYSNKVLCSCTVIEQLESYAEKPQWAKKAPYEAVITKDKLEPV